MSVTLKCKCRNSLTIKCLTQTFRNEWLLSILIYLRCIHFLNFISQELKFNQVINPFLPITRNTYQYSENAKYLFELLRHFKSEAESYYNRAWFISCHECYAYLKNQVSEHKSCLFVAERKLRQNILNVYKPYFDSNGNHCFTSACIHCLLHDFFRYY